MGNWSLNKKIWAVVGMLAFAFMACSTLAVVRMSGIRADLNEITTGFVKRDQLAGDIKDNQRQLTIAAMEIILEENGEKIKAIKDKIDTALKVQNDDLASYRAIASEKGQGLVDKYRGSYDQWVPILRKTEALATENKNEEAFAMLSSGSPFRSAQLATLKEIEELSATRLADKSASANESASTAILLTVIIASLSILASMLVAYFILRAVTKSVAQIVNSLADSSEQVTAAALQIASSSQELSEATTEQAASLEETAASIEEVSSMVNRNSENAKNAASSSAGSQTTAEKGKEVVEVMMKSMEEINQSNNAIMAQINHSNNEIGEIVKVIQEIGNKTKVINDIVFQTKLLSFNASVEAARAGEHGKGFAVVAEEVGNLAQMSGNAAKEITALLDGSIHKVESIVTDTKSKVEQLVADGRAKVDAGTSVARQCGDVLNEIVTSVSGVSQLAGEISTASQEQAQGVHEITKAVNQLDQVTQQNSATSQQTASAAEELSAQSVALKGAVDQLVSTIQGGKRAEAATYAKPEKRNFAAKPKDNVVTLKPGKAKKLSPAPMKMASGDGVVPPHNHAGFDEV